MYGGTKAELQRLISDASKMTDVQEKLGMTVDESSMSFDNIVKAIHVVQTEMGIAGTTAEEAEHTISGSIGMLQSSWQNFLTGVFDENADMGALGEQLFNSIGAVLQNVVPRILVLVQRIFTELPGAILTGLQAIPELIAPSIVSIFGEQIGGQINTALGGGVAQLVTTFQNLGASLMGLFTTIATTLQPVIELVVSAIATAMPLVQQAISIVIDFVTQKVIPAIQNVLTIFQPVIQEIVSTIQQQMPAIQEIISNVMSAIQTIIETVWPVVSNIITTAAEAIKLVIDNVWPYIQGIIETVLGVIKDVSSTVWPEISGFVETASDAINDAIDGLKPIAETVQGIFDSVKEFIEDPLGSAQEFIEDFASTISDIIGGLDLSLPSIALPHFNVWGGEFPWGIGGQGSAPEFSVDWYAAGGIVGNATLIGAGERGNELIWPSYEPYFDKYAKGIAEHMPNAGVDIHDCTFNVRKESDIRRVAIELNNLVNRQRAGGIA